MNGIRKPVNTGPSTPYKVYSCYFSMYKKKIKFKQCVLTIPRKGFWQTAQMQGLHGLFSGISIRNRNEINNTTGTPENWKWNRPIDRDGGVH